MNNNLDKNLEDLEEKLGYKFNDINLLKKALSHSSYAHEHGVESNEKLEFLGDAILEFVSSKYIYNNFPHFNEGMLTKLRAQVVCKDSLSSIAKERFGLEKYLLLGKSQKTSETNYKSQLEDALEAIIAAIMLDSSLENATKFIIKNFKEKIEFESRNVGEKDYKTHLQEILQKIKPNVKISYELIDEQGPDHSKIFKTQLLIDDKKVSEGIGKSKKASEIECAKKAIKIYANK